MKTIYLLLISLTLVLTAHAGNKNEALIYDGPGNCEDGCFEAAVEVAKMAGLVPRAVKPEALTAKSTDLDVKALFANAKVWIQPGGIANESFYTMNERVADELIEFVKHGGGYVGFCAGAFMATNPIGGTRDYGLGVFPGRTAVFKGYWAARRDLVYGLTTVNWLGKNYEIFIQGGPYLYGYEYDKNVEVIATYSNGLTAAARTTLEKGRVFITGLHPEAPPSWTEEDGIKDPDGSEQQLAVSMIHWAAGLETRAEKKAERAYFKLQKTVQK